MDELRNLRDFLGVVFKIRPQKADTSGADESAPSNQCQQQPSAPDAPDGEGERDGAKEPDSQRGGRKKRGASSRGRREQADAAPAQKRARTDTLQSPSAARSLQSRAEDRSVEEKAASALPLRQGDPWKLLLSCVGIGYSNLARPLL